jgi:hypothetical protein
MLTTLNDADLLPLSQPYGNLPWNYAGTESVSSMPSHVVDWVLVELRSGTEAGTAVDTAAALLRSDGTIVRTNGDILSFPTLAGGPFHVVVHHRNHASVMTSTQVLQTNSSSLADVASGSEPAFGTNGINDLGGGRYALFACDANADGFVTAPDFNLWNASTTAGETGYLQADCNLDGNVTAPDFNLWNANTTAGAASQVPN